MKNAMKIMMVFWLSLVLLAGCASVPTPEAPAVKPSEAAAVSEPVLAFAFCASHQQNDFIKAATRTIVKAAEAEGVSMTVFDGNQNSAKQVGQVENLITQGIDGILIEPVSRDALAPAITACKEAGIPVITFNQRVTNQAEANSFVGVDMVQGGVLEMEQAASVLKGNGSIVILHGPMGGDAQAGRNQGYRQVLARYPQIHVLAEQSANWVREDSYSIMENWIQSGKEIDAVVSQNDDMALGAIRAIEEAGLTERIRVFGLDATPEGLAAVEEGRMNSTISQNTDKQGAIAVKALIDAAKGKPLSQEYLIDHVLISAQAK